MTPDTRVKTRSLALRYAGLAMVVMAVLFMVDADTDTTNFTPIWVLLGIGFAALVADRVLPDKEVE